MQIWVSQTATLTKMDQLAKGYDARVMHWKESIENQLKGLNRILYV